MITKFEECMGKMMKAHFLGRLWFLKIIVVHIWNVASFGIDINRSIDSSHIERDVLSYGMLAKND